MRAGASRGVVGMTHMIISYLSCYHQRRMSLASVIGLPPRVSRAVIGMVHLRALPGSPRWDGDMAAAQRAAPPRTPARAEGGAAAVLVANHGAVPSSAPRV